MPLGLINVTVAETSIKRGLSAALWVALGAALVELIQAFAAIKLAGVFMANQTLDRWFNGAAAGLFLLLTIYYFFLAKPVVPGPAPSRPGGTLSGFFRGVLVSSMNVMVFPYWIFYGTYLSSNGWLLLDNLNLGLFSLGVMAGTFLLLWLYARLGRVVMRRATLFTRRINSMVGGIFLLLTIYQGWKVLQLL